MTAVADKLREARALVALGWCQENYVKDGCVCSYGAIQQAVTGDPTNDWDDPRTKPLEDAFRAAIETIWIVNWNDAPERTQAEVIAAFDKAIELAERDQ